MAVGFVVSFFPFVTNDFSAGTAVALIAMHPIVAGLAIVFLRPLITEPCEA